MLRRRALGSAAMALASLALLASCSLLPPGPDVIGSSLADDDRQADAEMQHIMDAVKRQDAAALKNLFSKTARAKAVDLDNGNARFLTFFPSGFKNLGEPDGGPGMTGDDAYGKRTTLLNANYKVRANGATLEVYFADYSVNQLDDPNNVGLYALRVAPFNAYPTTRPTAASEAFFAWQSQFDIRNHKATGVPSVFVYAPAG
jgi:hypothetical protein